MNAVLVKTNYSAAELASLCLPGLPTSKGKMLAKASREGWAHVEVKSIGGVRREYQPPVGVMKAIKDLAANQLLSAAAPKNTGTITRDLIYPMVAVNMPGIEGLSRCPRFVLETEQPEDMAAYASALPKMVAVGFQIPLKWAQERLHIPQPRDGEAILTLRSARAPGDIAATAALSATIPAPAAAPAPSPVPDIVAQLGNAAAPVWANQIGHVGALVARATSLASLQDDMLAAFGGAPQETMVQLMAAAFALAELTGLSDAQGGA